MKRLFSSVLCAAALVLLTACGGGQEKPTQPPATASAALTTPAPLPTPTPASTPEPAPTPTPEPAPTPTPESMPVTAATPVAQTPAPEAADDGWLSRTAGTEVGTDKPAALAEATVDGGVLRLCFVPLPTEEGLNAFTPTGTEPPLVRVDFNAEFGVLFVTLHNTVLKSGEPESGEEDWVYDYVRDQGLSYPYSVATGSLGADNDFFTKPAISSNGTDVTITLMLTDGASEYRVDTGHRTAELFPTVEISFRAHEPRDS